MSTKATLPLVWMPMAVSSLTAGNLLRALTTDSHDCYCHVCHRPVQHLPSLARSILLTLIIRLNKVCAPNRTPRNYIQSTSQTRHNSYNYLSYFFNSESTGPETNKLDYTYDLDSKCRVFPNIQFTVQKYCLARRLQCSQRLRDEDVRCPNSALSGINDSVLATKYHISTGTA